MALRSGRPQGGVDLAPRGGDTRFDTLSFACDMGDDVTTQSGQPPQATPTPLSRVGNGTVPANGMNDVELLERAASASQALREAIGARVVGQGGVIELMLVALLAQGHALIVGVPGLAKTLLVASLAEALDLSFGRVQFTPDLLPADITGTDVLHEEEEEGGNIRRRIRFLPGPIFENLILADEINRTPPKTQAALLQAMQERRVTVGTTTHRLPDPFQVFATRNPIEQEGTYPLPEAQLDRFLLEIHIDYPSETEEREIARRTTSAEVGVVPRVLTAGEVRALQLLVPRVPVTDAAIQLAVTLGRATRPSAPGRDGVKGVPAEVREFVRFGAGPRGSQALVLAAKARAALHGEAAADVDDVRALVTPVLRHRLVLSYRAEAEGVRDVDVLARIVASVG
jgi:MoxR-like ATPase